MKNKVLTPVRVFAIVLACAVVVAAFAQESLAVLTDSPEEQAIALKTGRRLLELEPAKASEILQTLVSSDSIAADYASYDLASHYMDEGRYDEAAFLLRNFNARFRYSPIKKIARQKEIESLCNNPADKRCKRVVRSTGPKAIPRSFRPALEFIKAQLLESYSDRTGTYRQYQKVYYRYPVSKYAEMARKATVRLRRDNPKQKYPSPVYSEQMKRAKRLMKAFRYEEAETALLKMKKVGYDPGRQEEVLYRLCRAQYKGRKRLEAKKNYEEFLSLYPKSIRVTSIHYSIAIIDWNLDRDQASRKRLLALLDKNISKKTRSDIHLILGRIAASEGDEEGARKQFEEGLKQTSTTKSASRFSWYLGWLDYRNGKSDEAAKRFLEAEKRTDDKDGRFAYWAARALNASGDSVAAERKIEDLRATKPHTYYGAIAKKVVSPCPDCAISALGRGNLIQFAKRYESTRGFTRTERQHLVRHHAFASAGLFKEAKREADFISAKRKKGAEEALWLGILYRQAGRSGRSIILQGSILSARKAKGDFGHPFWRVFYPVDYWTDVAREASLSGTDPFLAFSVIRQESAFNPEAHSPANARGLMQLIPSTGRNTYRDARLEQTFGKTYDNRLLFEPAVNIKLGIHYLNGLIDRYDGNITFALAAYNAGEKAVDKWINRYQNVSDDEFVEMIPYSETRGYVKRVKRNLALYHNIYLVNDASDKVGGVENSIVAEN